MLGKLNEIEEEVVSDAEVMFLVAQSLQKQTIRASESLTNAVGQLGKDVDKQTLSIGYFAETIKGLSLSKVQFETLSLLTKELISEQKKTGYKIDVLIEKESVMHEWEFTLNRDNRTEKTNSITAKQIK